MANDLTNILPKILAGGLSTLREMAVFPRLVNLDYGTDAAQKGQVINVPIPVAQTASDVTNAPTHSSAASNSPGVIQIPLDQWKKTNFFLSDKEMVEVERTRHYLPMQSAESVKVLGNTMDTYIWDQYIDVYGYVGTAGVTPWSAVATSTDARKVLNVQLAPLAGRRIVMNPDAEAQALQLAAFSNFEQTNDMAVKIEGTIGRKFGFDHYMDQNVSSHVAGTVATAIVGSTTAAGSSTLGIAAQATAAIGTLVTGDVFTIAGDSQTYVVTSASATVSIAQAGYSIRPALKVIASANAVITKKATHVVNLGFTRDAFAFATRPLMANTASLDGGNMMMQATDPVTGLSLRLEVVRQNKQNAWEFDVLFGGKCVRPEMAVRIAG